MRETICSVGIDIGTSTTQLVFSRLTMENRSAGSMIPRIEIVGKEIVYRSPIYFTPLCEEDRIDAGRLKEILKKEYAQAERCENRGGDHYRGNRQDGKCRGGSACGQ